MRHDGHRDDTGTRGHETGDHEGWFRNSRIVLLYFFAAFVIIRYVCLRVCVRLILRVCVSIRLCVCLCVFLCLCVSVYLCVSVAQEVVTDMTARNRLFCAVFRCPLRVPAVAEAEEPAVLLLRSQP